MQREPLNTGLDFTPAVGDMAFTPLQRELLTVVNRLGREKFAPRAAQWDREASFPFANYEDLREAGGKATSVYPDHAASMKWQAKLHALGLAAPHWPPAKVMARGTRTNLHRPPMSACRRPG